MPATVTPTATVAAAGSREPPEPLCASLCWLLSQASHALTVELTAAFEGIGVSPRAHAVLTTALMGTYTQTELAKLVGLDKTTMVVTVDELEAAGLAERLPSPADRRVRVIAVTKAGKRKVAQAGRIADALTDEVLSTLPARERGALVDGLSRLLKGRLAAPATCMQQPRRRALRT